MTAGVIDRRAPSGARVGHALLLAVAGGLAVAATFGALRSTQGSTPWLHWAAAGFAVFAGSAMLWAGIERAGREGRRRPYILWFTAGTSLWLFGQALGYLIGAEADATFDPRIEAIPLLVGLPLAIVGAVGLTKPAALDRRTRHQAGVDAVVAGASLLVIWAIAVIPQWAVVPASQYRISRLDQLLLLSASISFVALISFSRRPGSLPLQQLAMFIGGLVIVVLADLMGEFGPDRVTDVTISLVGYWAGVALLVAMLHRSAAEPEPAGQARLRTAVAVGVPFGLLVIAGLLLIDAAQQALPDSVILVVMPAIWAIAVLLVGIARAADQRADHDRATAASAAQLGRSAQDGWVGALLADSSEYVFVLEVDATIVYSSPRCRHRLARAHSMLDLLPDTERDSLPRLLVAVLAGSVSAGPYDMRLLAADGSWREAEAHLRVVKEVSFEGFVLTATDVTDTRRLVQTLDLTKRHDELTGLLTRDAFVADLADILTTGAGRVGVAVLDLNDLGVWNETLGRAGGDAILRAVAQRFEHLPQEVVAVGRIAGDAFGLIAVGPAAGQAIETGLERLTDAMRGLLLPDDTEVDVSFRAGYSTTPPQVPAQQLLDQADVALRRARTSRNSTVVAFRAGMNDDLVRRLGTEQRIREALNGNGIEVHYQPIVTVHDGSVHELEALVRLRTPDGSLLSPDTFLPAAEYSGLLRDIDYRVRQIVGEQWQKLADAGQTDLRINVNVHEMELDGTLIKELLDRDLAHKVVLEVTEDSLLSRPEEAAAALDTFRRAGGLVAIDDFGTGYSSLSQILSLPCDVLKIDRSFVARMGQPRTLSLVRATVQLAHDLGLTTVAEGVESRREADALQAMGCDRLQGYWYAHPQPLTEMVGWLQQRNQ